MTDVLLLRLLGPLEASREGRQVGLGPPKRRAVLGCLALARGRVVSVDGLLEAVWGDQLPVSAVTSLQVHVSHLRRLVGRSGDGGLERVGPGYRLGRPAVEVDTDEAEELAARVRTHAEHGRWSDVVGASGRVLELDRGPLLADLEETPWLREQREAWAVRLGQVRVTRVAALLATGQVDQALAECVVLRAAQPLREDLVRLQALTLARSSQSTQALELLAAHAARLDEDLGLSPGPELRELQVALLRQDEWTRTWPRPTTEAAAGPGAANPPAPAGVPRGTSLTPRADELVMSGQPDPLVGRDGELRAIGALVEQVLSGHPATVVLTGPAGIGKTRLARATIDMVERAGGRAVRSQSTADAGAPAWWPVRQLVRGLGLDPGSVLSAADDTDADFTRFAIYERLCDTLEEVALAGPVALLVDDLQWVDEASASALAHVAASVDGPVLLVATVRDEEVAPALQRVLDDLLRAGTARHLAVPPLVPSAVGELAQLVAGVPMGRGEVEELMAMTGGNALFVSEYARLPREGRAHPPMAVRSVLGRRVGGLSGSVLETLRVAGVLGDPVEVSLLAAVSGRSYDEVLDALDQAASHAVIEAGPDGVGYAFCHALLRSELRAGLSVVRRQRVHLRAAEVLGMADQERVTARAGHLTEAGPLAEADAVIGACRAAAQLAERRASPETAAEWWARAAAAADRLPDDRRDDERDELVVAQVGALVRAGQGQTALDAIDAELLTAAQQRRTTTLGRLAAALLRTAGTWPWVASGQDRGPVLARLRAAEPLTESDPAARSRLLASLAAGHCYDPDPGVPDRLSLQALDLARAGDDPEVLADALLGRVLTYVGEAGHAEQNEGLLAELIELQCDQPASADLAVAHSAMTMSRFQLGDVDGVERHLELAAAGADLLRLPVLRAQCRWMSLGVTHWRSGPEQAMQMHADASASHLSTELYESSGFAQMTFHALLWDLGRLQEVEVFDGYESVCWAAAGAAARAQQDRARDLVRRRLSDPSPTVWATLAHLVVLAHTVGDVSDRELAASLLPRLEPYAGLIATFGQGPVAGPVDLARARLLHVLGRRDDAREVARAASDLCRRTGGSRWADRTDQLLGAWTAATASRRPAPEDG